MIGPARDVPRTREANEALATLARDGGRSAPVGFLCECPDDECFQPVPLALGEYEVLRHVWAPVVGHGMTPAVRRT